MASTVLRPCSDPSPLSEPLEGVPGVFVPSWVMSRGFEGLPPREILCRQKCSLLGGGGSSYQPLSRVRLCDDPVNCSTPGFPVLHHLPEFAQTHVHSIWPSQDKRQRWGVAGWGFTWTKSKGGKSKEMYKEYVGKSQEFAFQEAGKVVRTGTSVPNRRMRDTQAPS